MQHDEQAQDEKLAERYPTWDLVRIIATTVVMVAVTALAWWLTK